MCSLNPSILHLKGISCNIATASFFESKNFFTFLTTILIVNISIFLTGCSSFILFPISYNCVFHVKKLISLTFLSHHQILIFQFNNCPCYRIKPVPSVTMFGVILLLLFLCLLADWNKFVHSILLIFIWLSYPSQKQLLKQYIK